MAEEPRSDERPIATVYPSIASLAAGRFLGVLLESIPIRFGSAKLSHLLFALPAAPLALMFYFWLKIAGPRYGLTTHRVQIVPGPAGRTASDMPLDEVGRIDVRTTFGQKFYRAGDLIVHDHVGTQRLRLRGVVRPEMFRQTILESRDALIRTDAARRVIEARHRTDAGAA